MKPTVQQQREIAMQQVDPRRRRARMYHLAESTSLFGERGLIVTWGSIGRSPRVRFEPFDSDEALEHRWRELLARRAAHGYRVCDAQPAQSCVV